MNFLKLATTALVLAVPLVAQDVVDDFENGANEGSWSVSNSTVETSGGNPGAWLRGDGLTTPAVLSLGLSAFTGDWRARNVTSIGLDLRVESTLVDPHSEPVVLVLLTDGGTPGSIADDCRLWILGSPGPQIQDGWVPFDFPISAASTTLPANVTPLNFPGTPCEFGDDVWNSVITGVTRISFQLGDPLNPGPANTWILGFDNIRLEDMQGDKFCFGDNSGSPCPCGNNSAVGLEQGCLNATGGGATLDFGGSTSVTQDNVSFALGGGVPSSFGLLASGSTQLPAVDPGAGLPVFDGLRCVGGGLSRHGSRAIDASGDAQWGQNGGFASAQGFSPGATRHFQVFYRDNPAGVCLTGRNQSPGLTLTFAP